MEKSKNLKKIKAEITKKLESKSKKELLNMYALLLNEKEQLQDFKDTYDDYQQSLDCIVNSAKFWLVKNDKNNHYLYISTKKIELIQNECVVTKWI